MSAASFVRRGRERGVSLVELMISMLLGLLVVGSAITVFISNRQTYRATENLGRIQENARIAFELMARDLREAGGNPCERDLPTANVLTTANSSWWNTWGSPITGFGPTTAFGDMAFGTAASERLTGTDALVVRSAISGGLTVSNHVTTTATITTNVNHRLSTGDIVMICDFDHGAIVQLSSAVPGTNTLVHAASGVSPGNSTICLSGGSGTCGTGVTNTYSFGCYQGKRLSATSLCAPNPDGTASPTWPAYLAKLQASRWYIANNPRGGRSLYREGLVFASGAMGTSRVEIAENVTDMELSYLPSGATAYVTDATTIADWNTVTAVRIVLTVASAENIGTDGQRIDRRIEHIVALRNRTT
jgi:type IV pilus assembly protein PilW